MLYRLSCYKWLPSGWGLSTPWEKYYALLDGARVPTGLPRPSEYLFLILAAEYVLGG